MSVFFCSCEYSFQLLERLREILVRVFELDSIVALCAQPSKEPDVAKCESNISQVRVDALLPVLLF